MKNKFPFSWLRLVNLLVFQWFFIRLTKCEEKIVREYIIESFDSMPNGSMASRGSGKIIIYNWYAFQYWILPLTGWKGKFIYLNKEPKFIQASKKYSNNL